MAKPLLVTVALVLAGAIGLARLIYVASRRERKVLTRKQRAAYGDEAPKRFKKDLEDAQDFNMLWLKGYVTPEEAEKGYKIGGLRKQAPADDQRLFLEACKAFDASIGKTASADSQA